MGGNLWFFGATADAALDAATAAAAAASTVPGVILPFPGGVASSGSKAGSRYKFTIASTYAEYCPTLRGKEGVKSRLPEGVASVQEIIINGADLPTIVTATQAAIAAAKDVPGPADHLSGELRRAARQELHLPAPGEAAGVEAPGRGQRAPNPKIGVFSPISRL